MKKIIKVKLTVSFKNDFIPFLENNQACKDYISNVLTYQGLHLSESNKDREETLQNLIWGKLQNSYPIFWVSGLFSWSDTDQDLAFWDDIHQRWQRFLQTEAGIENFEDIGEISKFDVEEVFFSKSLRGQYYKVTDLSYNRPVTDKWNCEKWTQCDSSVKLHETGGIYLILSDYPEGKVMLWHGMLPCPRPMIKVWIPELNRAQWVFYESRGLQKTE